MSRYIDAKNLTLIKNLANLISEYEVIDIVRCKECRYYHQLYGCQKNDDIDLVTSDDDFCSYGEREGE